MNKHIRQQAIQRQADRISGRVAHLQQISQRLSWLRLGLFLASVVAAGLAGWRLGFPAGVVTFLVTQGVFAGAVFINGGIDERLREHQAWLDHKRIQLARMSLDWANIPYLTRFTPRYEHPFEADLDLVGERSLHRLLDTPVSREGSRLLHEWLTEPEPDLSTLCQRQALVAELRPRSLFRDKLIMYATATGGSRKLWDGQRLLNWLTPEKRVAPAQIRRWLAITGGLAALNFVLFGLNMAGILPPFWQGTFVLYLALVMFQVRLAERVFSGAGELHNPIVRLEAVFRHIERFGFHGTPQLKALCAPFLDGPSPAQTLRRTAHWILGVNVRSNPFTWVLLNALIPWDLLFAERLNRCKLAMAERAPAWLSTWSELEAASALANLGYLNPRYTLPTLTETTSPVFEARQLGHPLLPDAVKVRNDFTIEQLGQIGLITGSNMAGKSTFLRTVGINLVLAYAGGPVDADALRTVCLRLFTAINVSDSVTDGISYFYAEVKRLKALLVALERQDALPLCMFIDEIFRGTNNQERFIGSRSYIESVAGQRGVGLISTHDLELAKLADTIDAIQNYHFRDDVKDAAMHFDYLLRPGPCPTTNALKIMRLEGLPVRE